MRTETLSGYHFVTRSNVTDLHPGTRVTNDEFTGMLLGFSVPRGYAILNIGAGQEVLAHPEGLRAVNEGGRIFEKVSIEEVGAP